MPTAANAPYPCYLCCQCAVNVLSPLLLQCAAKHVVMMMTGAKKADAVATALATQQNPGDFPAQMVRPADDATLTWLLDAGAASKLTAVTSLGAIVLGSGPKVQP